MLRQTFRISQLVNIKSRRASLQKWRGEKWEKIIRNLTSCPSTEIKTDKQQNLMVLEINWSFSVAAANVCPEDSFTPVTFPFKPSLNEVSKQKVTFFYLHLAWNSINFGFIYLFSKSAGSLPFNFNFCTFIKETEKKNNGHLSQISNSCWQSGLNTNHLVYSLYLFMWIYNPSPGRASWNLNRGVKQALHSLGTSGRLIQVTGSKEDNPLANLGQTTSRTLKRMANKSRQ